MSHDVMEVSRMRVRRKIIALVVTTLAAAAWIASAAPAHAGGPTSVLLVNPETGRANALYHTDNVYQRLADGVGAFGPDVGSTDKPPSASVGSEIRLTWMIHDMSVWRIDRVHLTPHDGTWVETLLMMNQSGDIFDRPGRWHRAANEKVLMASLAAAGMIAGSKPPAGEPASTVPAGEASTVPPAAEPTASQAAPASVTGGGRAPATVLAVIAGAGMAGLVVGATATLALARARRGKAPRVDRSG
jgi:hypothetical protein